MDKLNEDLPKLDGTMSIDESALQNVVLGSLEHDEEAVRSALEVRAHVLAELQSAVVADDRSSGESTTPTASSDCSSVDSPRPARRLTKYEKKQQRRKEKRVAQKAFDEKRGLVATSDLSKDPEVKVILI